eukprot:SAG31_NODE_4061_length_3629_cov_2.873371_3_plen_177_part_00
MVYRTKFSTYLVSSRELYRIWILSYRYFKYGRTKFPTQVCLFCLFCLFVCLFVCFFLKKSVIWPGRSTAILTFFKKVFKNEVVDLMGGLLMMALAAWMGDRRWLLPPNPPPPRLSSPVVPFQHSLPSAATLPTPALPKRTPPPRPRPPLRPPHGPLRGAAAGGGSRRPRRLDLRKH